MSKKSYNFAHKSANALLKKCKYSKKHYMKRFFLLSILSLLVGIQSSWAYHWGDPEKFVTRYSIDRAFKFDNDQGRFDKSSESGVNLIDFPGFIALNCMSCDRYNAVGSNYAVSWVEYYLKNAATGETVLLGHVDFTSGGSGDREHIYKDECNVKSISKGAETTVFMDCQKRFYDDYWDGSKWIYFLVGYTESTRQFMVNAGSNLKLYVKMDYDGEKSFEKSMNTGELINGQVSLSTLSWVNKNNSSHDAPQISCPINASITPAEYALTAKQQDRVLGLATGYMTDGTTVSLPINTAKMNGTDPITITANASHSYSIDGTRWNVTKVSGTRPDNNIPFRMQPDMSHSIAPIQYPCQFSGTDERNGNIKIQWSMKDAKAAQDNSPFIVQTSLRKDFSTIIDEQEVSFQSGKDKYEIIVPMQMRSKDDVTYYSRLRRGNTSFGNPDIQCETSVNTNYAHILKGSFRVDSIHPGADEGTVYLSWQATAGVWNDSLRYELSIQDQSTPLYFNDRNVHTSVKLPTCETKTLTLRVLYKDQAISTETIRVTSPSERNSIISRLDVSKGYYTDRVTIDWDIDPNADNFHHFDIHRFAYDSNDTVAIELDQVAMVHGRNHYRLEDQTCVPGIYYAYRIIGYQKCGDENEQKPIYTLQDIGFSQPFGTVSGSVTYSGNQGVKNAIIHLEGQDNQQQHSLYIAVNKSDTARAWVSKDRAASLLQAEAGTIMLWAKTAAEHTVLIHQQGKIHIELKGDTLLASLTQGTNTRMVKGHLTSKEGYLSSLFNHYSVCWDKQSIELYLNSRPLTLESADANAAPQPADGDLLLGSDGTVFAPLHLDELAFYSEKKDSSYIGSHYSMYLNGNEPGLEGYYRFDENLDGVCFDLSCNTSMTSYHSRHAYIEGAIHDGNNIPGTTQLSYRAYTDTLGNYLIKRIPFTESGTLYRVVPELGIHKFGPTNRQLYFNTSASTHNNMDFTDESSFKVSGHVYYEHTDYPVAGCNFYVDGQPCTFNGNMIESDEKGAFSIQVPIGDHYIQVKKNNHTFADNGRFPADPNNVGTLMTFDRELNTVVLYDNTLVKVTGRVAGGEREQMNPHCLGVGKNNLGVAQIELTAGDRYNLNMDRKAARVFSIPDSINCHSLTTAGKYGDGPASQTITIRTDSATGEFYAMLPPIPLTVKSARVPSNSQLQLRTDTCQTIDLSKVITLERQDTLRVDKTLSSCKYNYKFDLIQRNVPEFRLIDLANGSKALGLEYIVVSSGDTAALYTLKNDSVQYALGHPVFKEGDTYRWNIELVERFTNADHKDTVYVDSQPWKDGIVTIENELGVRQVALRDTTSSKGDATPRGGTLTLNSNQLRLDSVGRATYTWIAGAPNIMAPYTLGMRITYTDAAARMRYAWDGNNNFQGIVLGNLQEGNNIITAGPDELLYILRCPPGSNSTATWEKNTSVTTLTERTTFGDGENQDVQTFKLGGEVVNGAGLGFMVITSVSNTDDLSVGVKQNWNRQNVHVTTKKITATESVSIVRTRERLGADADVFYGHSTNLIIGMCSVVMLERDEEGKLHVVMHRQPGVGTKMKTLFALSQYDVINKTIPDLINMRNSLLRTVPESEYLPTYKNDSTANIYITKLRSSDPDYGKDSTYLCIRPTDSAKRNGTLYDEVSYYNSQVNTWHAYLAANERAKVMAIDAGDKKYDNNKFNAANSAYRKYKTIRDLYLHLKEMPDKKYVVTKETEPGSYLTDYMQTVYKTVCSSGHCSEVPDYQYVCFKDVEKAYKDFGYPAKMDSILFVGDFYKDAGWFEQNRTISGGVKVSASHATSEATTTGINYTWSVKGVINNVLGFSINKLGMVNTLSTANGGGHINRDNTTTDSTTTISYSIAPTTNENFSTDIYHAPDGFGPIFRMRGGTTGCPYEDKQQTRFFEPGQHTISEPTLRLQNPVIRLTEAGTSNFMKNMSFTDKPAGQAIPIFAQLQNASGITSAVTAEKFNIRPLLKSDSLGLNIMIDGYTLGTEGQPVILTCGGQILQTLTVQQTNMAINRFENIGLILSSDCDPLHTADTCYFSIDFVPACAPLRLSAPSLVINMQTGDSLALRLSDINPAYIGLEKVFIQYRRQGSTTWNMALTVDKAKLRADNLLYLEMSDGLFSDGEYDIRAVSHCMNNGEPIENESEILHVIRDTKRPEAIRFLPESGIYTPGTEIGVEWSKAINTGRLTESCFRITGAMNGDSVSHAVALSLSSEAYTEARYMIAGTPFNIEMWLKYTQGGRLFSHADTAMVAQIEQDGHLTITIGQKTYRSSNVIPRDKWCHLQIALEQNATASTLSAKCRYDASTITLMENQPTDLYYRNGILRLGGGGIEATINELSIWDRIRTDAEVVEDMNLSLMSNATSLVSCWHLDEGTGVLAEDKVRARSLHVSENAWVLDGANYALHVTPADSISLPISTIQADEHTDYLLELWFRTQSADTLLRVMAGNVSTLTIGFQNGKLHVSTDYNRLAAGVESALEIPGTEKLQDGAWHQLRINYRPNGNTTFTIDNIRILQTASTYVRGLRGDRISFESGFTGDIDEVRLWHARVTDDIATERSRQRMTGSEKGLSMCYSFEKSVKKQGVEQTVFDYTDLKDSTRSVAFRSASLQQASSCPPLRQARTEKEIAYTFIASENKVILRPTVPANLIEGIMLHCTAENVYDLHDNWIETTSWSVFVQRAGMLWGENQYHMDAVEGESGIYELMIINLSSEVQNYMIRGVPTWMSLSQYEGSLEPGMTRTITMRCEPLAVGYHYATLQLTDNHGITTSTRVLVHVTSHAPNWQVDEEKFSGSMNIIGTLNIDNRFVEDEESILAAFIGNECVGLARSKFFSSYNGYYTMMTIFGREETAGQPITFKIWDATDGCIYTGVKVQYNGSTKRVVYRENQVLGSLDEPYYFLSDASVEQTIALSKGWNWTSFYVAPSTPNINDIVKPILHHMNQIKDAKSFSLATDSMLVGNVRNCFPREMYKIDMKAADTLVLSGKPYNPQADNMAITLRKGWNWIGFIAAGILSPAEALGDLNPFNGDILKSRHSFAIWDERNSTWTGTLTAMTPGEGYMYRSLSPEKVTFRYPGSTYYARRVSPYRMPEQDSFFFRTNDEGNYSTNMSIVARILKGTEVVSHAELAGFVGSECRGTVGATDDLWFLSVEGEEGESITLHVYAPELGDIITNVTIDYRGDGLVGSLEQPLEIQLVQTAIERVSEDEQPAKFIRNGILYIRRAGKVYTAIGQPQE